ncbi:MAG: methionine synthase [Actinomycetia bacterium]|nr:methionine synthase [Actinomycetes bacterium]
MSAAPTGIATGIGSLPGEEPREAMALIVDSLPELPHVPELPARGPWADMVGRAAAVLVDVPIEWEGSRWLATARVGRDTHRARAMLSEDLDAVEDRLQGYAGPAKLQICGPLTLAAVLELRGGEAAVSDPVATTDLAASLAEGLTAHIHDLQRRVPGAEWVVQVDEPALSSVTAGAIPRASGWGAIAAVPSVDAVRWLSEVTEAVEQTGAAVVLHSCATTPDWGVLTAGSGSGARAISFDLAAISLLEAAPVLEQWLDTGGSLWLGVDPVGSGVADGLEIAYARLVEVRSVLGVDPEHFAKVVAVTPPCGLGGSVDVAAASYAGVRTLMRRLRGDSAFKDSAFKDSAFRDSASEDRAFDETEGA